MLSLPRSFSTLACFYSPPSILSRAQGFCFPLYTPWQLLEHIRMAQWDILEFIRNPHYVSPPWPEGYWPAESVQVDEVAWEKTLVSFRADLQSLLVMVSDPKVNLYTPIPHGNGQNILREILVVADHNAYHISEFATFRQVMETW